jgi:hypothetical protein
MRKFAEVGTNAFVGRLTNWFQQNQRWLVCGVRRMANNSHDVWYSGDTHRYNGLGYFIVYALHAPQHRSPFADRKRSWQ